MTSFIPPAPCSLTLPESLIHWLADQELRRIRPDGSYSPSPVPPHHEACGIVIGIHYDLGYHPEEDILADWKGYFSDPVLRPLAAAGGLRGRTALHHHRSLPTINLPFEDALRFFRLKTVPTWVDEASRLWPRFFDLSPASQCALVSLIMHLGHSLHGPRRRELALVADSLAAGQNGPVPQLIRSLAFAYPPGPTHDRLLAEATLFASPPNPTITSPST